MSAPPPPPPRGGPPGFRGRPAGPPLPPRPPVQEAPWCAREGVGGAAAGGAARARPGVPLTLAPPLLHVGRGEQLGVGVGRHPPLLLGPVGALDDEREEDDPAAGGRADEL